MGVKDTVDLKLLDERALLALIADGNERAFKHLFGMYATPLAALAKRMLRDEEAKQEVIQEVFLKVWINRDRLEGVEKVNAWLRKMTINECLMYLRQVAAYRQKLGGVVQAENEPYESVDLLHIKELRQAVERAVAAMPPQRQAIYELSRSKGLNAKEIAEKMGLSHGYVRNALSAALASIREHLSPYIDITFIIFFLFF